MWSMSINMQKSKYLKENQIWTELIWGKQIRAQYQKLNVEFAIFSKK